MSQPGEHLSSDQSPASRSLGSVVGHLAHAIEHEISPGDVAELRRLRRAEPGGAAFYKLMAGVVAPGGHLPEGGAARDEAERRWSTVMQALAQLRGLHRPGSRAGAALATAELAELRLTRLLRARDEALDDAIRTTAHYLAARGEPVDAAALAALVLVPDGPVAEALRRAIARDYYGRVARNERNEG
ncbi:MAG TPA: type I-E CRISPR-associated protein Cse2/CasB [Polyangia bacterium]|jgi:hypothetical protein